MLACGPQVVFASFELEHAKTPPAAKAHHTSLRNNKIHTNRKEIGEKRNTTKNSHQTNTQEDKDQSYITT
jgi:hypothetical protein